MPVKRVFGSEDLAQSLALLDIAEHLDQRGRRLSDFPGLPELSSAESARLKTKLLRSELSYDAAKEAAEAARMRAMMTETQAELVAKVVSCLWKA